MKNELPLALRTLVRKSVAALGHTIKEEAGTIVFNEVEKLRKSMKGIRKKSGQQSELVLRRSLKRMRKLHSQTRQDIAHAFALMMELMNACEAAYRTIRIRQSKRFEFKNRKTSIVYVLTAHPTEARGVHCIDIFHRIQSLLIDFLENDQKELPTKLYLLLRIAWKIPVSNENKPTVEDEADHLYSILLRKELVQSFYGDEHGFIPVRIRTWVGGDKDGHPYVDEASMLKSLQKSRERILEWISEELDKIGQYISWLDASPNARDQYVSLGGKFQSAVAALAKLHVIDVNDGQSVLQFRRSLLSLIKDCAFVFGEGVDLGGNIFRLMHVFPSLVVPLEFRDSAEVFEDELKNNSNSAIARMLSRLKDISNGVDPTWYVRGLVVSHVESAQDMLNAVKVLDKNLGSLKIPVIPLFESRNALKSASFITKQILEISQVKKTVQREWFGKLEVMLGYSDSSKEMGVFPSRLLIGKALHQLAHALRQENVTPVFFHGTGGSVARGGGSVVEQTRWWPRSARVIWKSTIQGEMVQRSFASAEIFASQVDQLLRSTSTGGRSMPEGEAGELLEQFSESIRKSYEEKIQSSDFIGWVARTSPYPYLQKLKIGSRPVSRGGNANFASLRAIPWVLCWTQTRVLFPTWWGVGTAWKETSPSAKKKLLKLFRQHPFCTSFIKLLGFTLMKIEMPIWKIYVNELGRKSEFQKSLEKEFQEEYELSLRFIRAINGRRKLLWFRPWLAKSIELRSAMIHPLNLLQIIALQENDERLLRETVTGIASGMLTTG